MSLYVNSPIGPVTRLQGANLGDASVTIQPFSGTGFSLVYMPPNTMTADRTITLGNTSAPGAGPYWSLFIVRQDLTAFQLIIKKTDTTTIYTDPISPTQVRCLEFVCQNGVWSPNTAFIIVP